METRRIIERVYPALTEGAGPLRRRGRRWLRAKRWAARKARAVAVVLLFLTGWVVVHLYYYNELVGLEYDVDAAWAQVETQLQRRYHIQRNLTRMVLDYAKHERAVLTDITKLRAATTGGGGVCGDAADEQIDPPPSASPSAAAAGSSTPADESASRPGSPGAVSSPAGPVEKLSAREMQALFSRIMVVAEQYPQLKLSENFQQFSAAVIDTETEIAVRTAEYNDSVNKYGTTLRQFPGNVFAWIGGFESREFYRPDDEALKFRRVEY